MKQLLLPALALALLTQCHKNGPDPATTLPAATQTGAGTFGCLVNGRPWLPSGNNGTPNSVALYDRSINTPSGAELNIAAYRIADTRTYINLYCGPITSLKRIFTIGIPTNKPPLAEAFGCYEGGATSFCGSALAYSKGQLVLTRVDEKAGVVAGTFWFTAVRIGSSDTLKVTQGRFDYKI